MGWLVNNRNKDKIILMMEERSKVVTDFLKGADKEKCRTKISEINAEIKRLSEDGETPEQSESIIEHLMFDAFNQRWPEIIGYADDKQVMLRQQEKFVLNRTNYRVDFMLECRINDKPVTVIVECDGYDYHDGSKEKAERDKKRDRDFTTAGYKVVRFTGSEIYRDASKCVREIINLLRTIWQKGEAV